VLARFVDRNLTAVMLEPAAFATGEWLPGVHEALAAPRKASAFGDGATEAAAAILQRFSDVLG
jgi:predicted trehalose synthase